MRSGLFMFQQYRNITGVWAVILMYIPENYVTLWQRIVVTNKYQKKGDDMSPVCDPAINLGNFDESHMRLTLQ